MSLQQEGERERENALQSNYLQFSAIKLPQNGQSTYQRWIRTHTEIAGLCCVHNLYLLVFIHTDIYELTNYWITWNRDTWGHMSLKLCGLYIIGLLKKSFRSTQEFSWILFTVARGCVYTAKIYTIIYKSLNTFLYFSIPANVI